MSDTLAKKRVGLLERANLANKPPKEPDLSDENLAVAESAITNFHYFARQFNLEKAALFVRQKDTYALTLSHNIDIETIQHPETPALFWEAMYFSKYNEESWLTFSDDQLRSFLTLFSLSEQSSTDGILLKTFVYNDKKMILCILKSIDSNFPFDFENIENKFNDILPKIYDSQLTGLATNQTYVNNSKIFEALDDSYSAQLITLNLAPAFGMLNSEITEVDKSVFVNSVTNELYTLMGNHNMCSFVGNYAFSLVFVTREAFYTDLCLELIKERLGCFFNDETLNKILVQDEGSTNSKSDILNFLERKL